MTQVHELRTIGLALSVLLLAVGAEAACDRIPDCELVWADEFDGDVVDPTRWRFQLGTGTDYGLPAGWGNNELQSYQEANATAADGFLTITARRESVGGSNYTSARLRTLGRGEWTYGRFEMRARMPRGQGLWPAFWMLPSDPTYGTWAASGEIDIMEYLGHEPARILGTIHYGDVWPRNVFTGNSYDLPAGSFDAEFHVFAVEWERGVIRWYVDDVLYATQTEWFSTAAPYPAPFDVDFHLLLNLAVGGNLPGSPDDSTVFPQELVVDYVRVYQAPAIQGAQTTATTLRLEKPTRLKKVEATVAMPFENRARKRDKPGDPRQFDCRVDAFGSRGPLAAGGKVRLELVGRVGSAPWRSGAIDAALQGDGRALFAADEMSVLAERAAADGAEVERIEATYRGAGGRKGTRVDVDCRQMAER